MISNKKKFIFLHIPKTGGSSIEKALCRYSNKKVYKIPGNGIGLPGKHYKIKTIKNEYGTDMLNDYFKFTFIRNPFDRAVSFYAFCRYLPVEKFLKSKKTSLNKEWLSLSKEARKKDFNDWIISEFGKIPSFSIWPYLCNENDEIIVDFIARFKNIQRDFNIICEHIHVNIKLPHINKRKRKINYRNYYNNKAKNFISKYCKKEIEYFKYKF
jgi:hypothetical protein